MRATVRLRPAAQELGEVAADVLSPWRRLPMLRQEIGASEATRRIVRQQFRSMMTGCGGNLMASAAGLLLWVIALGSVQPSAALLLWSLAILAGLAYIAVLVGQFAARAPDGDDLRWWEIRQGRAVSLLGLAWGLVGTVLGPALRSELAPFMLIGLLLVVAGSVSLCMYRPLGAWMAVPCSISTCVIVVTDGGVLNMAIGIGFVVAVALLLHLARGQNTLLTQTMLAAEERLALLQELDDQRAEADHANRSKTRFLTAVSHDLRQPMHSIALLTGALRAGSIANANVIEQISASVQCMDDLLSALLDVSTLDTGTMPLRRSAIALGPLLERIEHQYAPQAQAKQLDLQVTPSLLHVVSDGFQLQRALSNLVANAIRYTAQGRVGLRCRRRGASVWIQVWDSGVGIAREHRWRIFEEFFRVTQADRPRNEGFGLGLSIVQRVAHRLGHRIAVRSRLGQGSVFSIELPLLAMPGATADAPATAAAVERLDVLAGQMVLLVDDEAAARNSMQTLLERFNCHVMAAHCGASALRLVEAQLRTPDLIISDYRLGTSESGLDVIAQVREAIGEAIPAWLVTAELTVPLQTALSQQINVLPKPLQLQRLAAELNRVLRGKP
jgi:signal transduction histidine kinase